MLNNFQNFIKKFRLPKMKVSRSLSVLTSRLVRFRKDMKEFQNPRASLIAGHPERTANDTVKIDTVTDGSQ